MATLAPAAQHVGAADGGHVLGQAVLHGQAVQVAAVLGGQLGDELGLPDGAEAVLHADRRQTRELGVHEDDAAGLVDRHFVHIDVADGLGVPGHEQPVEVAIVYVQAQLTENRERLLAEQAFRLEALLNPGLLELAAAHRKILVRGVDKFFRVLGSPQPEEDAKVLTGMILQMEYQGLGLS